jgi:hypothetical protein
MSFFFDMEKSLAKFGENSVFARTVDPTGAALSCLRKIAELQAEESWYVLPFNERLLWLIKKICRRSCEPVWYPRKNGKRQLVKYVDIDKAYLIAVNEIFKRPHLHPQLMVSLTEAVMYHTSNQFDEEEIMNNMLYRNKHVITPDGYIFRILDPGAMAFVTAWAMLALGMVPSDLENIEVCETVSDVFQKRRLVKNR